MSQPVIKTFTSSGGMKNSVHSKRLLLIIIIIMQHLYSAIMSYADTEALVAPVKSE